MALTVVFLHTSAFPSPLSFNWTRMSSYLSAVQPAITNHCEFKVRVTSPATSFQQFQCCLAFRKPACAQRELCNGFLVERMLKQAGMLTPGPISLAVKCISVPELGGEAAYAAHMLQICGRKENIVGPAACPPCLIFIF